MTKAKLKTTETEQSVAAFVKKITDKKRQEDCQTLIAIMEKQTGFPAKMWGAAIIGFGSYHYVYASGHEGNAPLAAFSPRKNEFALYIANFNGKEELLKNLGKHKTAKACVYIKKTEDINIAILKKLISGSVRHYMSAYK